MKKTVCYSLIFVLLFSNLFLIFPTQAQTELNSFEAVNSINLLPSSKPILFVDKLTASDGSTDVFGVSVSISGNTAFVSAVGADVDGNFGQGAVYVFTFTNGVWSQTAKLTASDGASRDFLGESVAIDGDIAIVGAHLADVDGIVDRGAAYVFTRVDGIWSQQAKLTPPDNLASGWFGLSVALDGNTAIVGSNGAVYVFNFDAGTWNHAATLIPNDDAGGFGWSLALDGDKALVGARNALVNYYEQGAVYVFENKGGSWSQQAKLTAKDGYAHAHFGDSVALDGNNALVGSWAAEAAYLFTFIDSEWKQSYKFTRIDTSSSHFGDSVDLDGNTVLIGAYGGWCGYYSCLQGETHVFRFRDGTWEPIINLVAFDGADGDGYGFAVAIDENTVIIGAPYADIDGIYNQGGAYVYYVPRGYRIESGKQLYLPIIFQP